MKRSTLLSFTLIFLLVSDRLHADYQLVRYNIVATTYNELIEQFKSQSPTATVGSTRNTSTITKTLRSDQDGCELVNVEYHHEIHIYMPKWLNKDSAKQCLQSHYVRMWAGIMRHELRHYEIYLELDRDMLKKLKSVRRMKNCRLMDAELDRRFNALIEDNKLVQEQFHKEGPETPFGDCND